MWSKQGIAEEALEVTPGYDTYICDLPEPVSPATVAPITALHEADAHMLTLGSGPGRHVPPLPTPPRRAADASATDETRAPSTAANGYYGPPPRPRPMTASTPASTPAVPATVERGRACAFSLATLFVSKGTLRGLKFGPSKHDADEGPADDYDLPPLEEAGSAVDEASGLVVPTTEANPRSRLLPKGLAR